MSKVMSTWVEPIVEHVVFNNGYINYEDFKQKLKDGDETAWLELDGIISEIAVEYGKDVESNYLDDYE